MITVLGDLFDTLLFSIARTMAFKARRCSAIFVGNDEEILDETCTLAVGDLSAQVGAKFVRELVLRYTAFNCVFPLITIIQRHNLASI